MRSSDEKFKFDPSRSFLDNLIEYSDLHESKFQIHIDYLEKCCDPTNADYYNQEVAPFYTTPLNKTDHDDRKLFYEEKNPIPSDDEGEIQALLIHPDISYTEAEQIRKQVYGIFNELIEPNETYFSQEHYQEQRVDNDDPEEHAPTDDIDEKPKLGR